MLNEYSLLWNILQGKATDLGLFEIASEGFILKEYAPGWTLEEIQAETEAKLTLATDAKEFRFR